jgi:Helix-turn-helix domain
MISMAEPFEVGSVLTERLAFNIADASSISGLSRASLYKLFKTGELRAVKIAGRRMVLREDLLAMLEAAKASQGNLTKEGGGGLCACPDASTRRYRVGRVGRGAIRQAKGRLTWPRPANRASSRGSDHRAQSRSSIRH